MQKEKLKIFENILLEQRKKTLEERMKIWDDIKNYSSEDRDFLNHIYDSGDGGSDSMDREKSFFMLSREDKYIQQIDQALEAIKNNEYGICRVCGQEISEERLMVVPTTSICVNCKKNQSAHSRNQE